MYSKHIILNFVFVSFLALENLHDHERQYIEQTVYTRGVELSYLQLCQMVEDVLFSSTLLERTPVVDSPTMPFVHRLNATNLTTGHLASHFRFYFPRKGTICLACQDVYDEDVETTCSYMVLKDKRMDIKGFEDIACLAELNVGSIVVVTVAKRWPRIGDMRLLKLVIYKLDR